MRSRWRLFLFIGLILSLASSAIGCGESYTQKDLENKYEALLLEKAILKAELETMQADVTYLRDASKTLRDDYDTLKAEYDTLKADYAISEATSKRLQADYDALKALYDDVSNELAEIKKPSELPEPPFIPTPKKEQGIEDLAYIKASAWPYSDDADPEYEGVSIKVSYYNSESKIVRFTGVPVTVTVELYMYTKPIYQKQVIMNGSGDLLGEVLRIPFEALPTAGDPNPILVVVVTTPTQGDFEYRGVTFLSWSRN